MMIKSTLSLFATLLCLNLFAQQWQTNGNHIYNTNFGNVGIGLQNPSAYTHIYGSINDYMSIVETDCGGSTVLKLESFSGLDLPDPEQPPLTSCIPKNVFETWHQGTGASNLRVRIDGYGRLGIGNNIEPTQDVDVGGYIRMRAGAGDGKIIVGLADGTMTWQSPSMFGVGFWEPMTGSSPGFGHIQNVDNGEVHIGNRPYSLFLDPWLGSTDYTFLANEGDLGIIFGPTAEDGDGSEPGLVIGPRNPGKPWGGMRIDWDGTVAIGNKDETKYTYDQTTGQKYMLAVDGHLIAELVRVKLHGDWPDFVFAKDYERLSLSELEDYIETNQHLPGIPNSDCVEEQGIDLGEMNRLLLQKIEELTLYMIEQEKEIEELKRRFENQ
ncbi:hypothetical protein KFE98_02560 [bacterium SCSIO 12741]|nr:hypothetical protein KFE98_02560 [bacterium SCSIO 12741]